MKTYSITDIGKKRSSNQDFVYASGQSVGALHNLLIVADGMGGHNAGDYASRCTVESMVDFIEKSDEKRPIPLLGKAIQNANKAVYEKATSDPSMEGMGTTVVAATEGEGYLYVANVGDSRLYLIDDEIEQITRDHSLVEEMVRAGRINAAEARRHPDKNIITRAVGTHAGEVRIDFFDMKLEKGDRILLCSDGLTNMVEDEEIFRIVKKSETLEEAGKLLINEANRNGGQDNISVVLAEFE